MLTAINQGQMLSDTDGCIKHKFRIHQKIRVLQGIGTCLESWQRFRGGRDSKSIGSSLYFYSIYLFLTKTRISVRIPHKDPNIRSLQRVVRDVDEPCEWFFKSSLSPLVDGYRFGTSQAEGGWGSSLQLSGCGWRG